MKQLLSWCVFLLIHALAAFAFLSYLESHRKHALLSLEMAIDQEQTIYRENEMLLTLQKEAAQLSENERRLKAMSWVAPSLSEAQLKFQEQIRKTLRTSKLSIHTFDSQPHEATAKTLQMRIHASGSLRSIQSALYHLESNLPIIEIISIRLKKERAPGPKESKLTFQMQLRGTHRLP